MNQFPIMICIVPESWWGSGSPQPEFVQMIFEALAIERRLPKGVDVEKERARYTICSRQIEQIVRKTSRVPREAGQYSQIIRSGKAAIGKLDKGYLVLLDKFVNAVAEDPAWIEYRIGASFFPPTNQNATYSLAKHIKGFEWLAQKLKLDKDPQISRRLSILRWANEQKCGIVEILDFYPIESSQISNKIRSSPHPIKRLDELVAYKSSSKENLFSVDENQRVSSQQRRSQRVAMKTEIERAIRYDQAVNINNYSNQVITDVLHDFVFTQEARKPHLLKIVYEDGSQGRPFPIFSLPQPKPEVTKQFDSIPPLRVAMLSIRHLEMDREVDMAWFRNTEASLRRTCFADTDFFCYKETLRQIDTLGEKEMVLIHLYQTGLEPAVVGFYRALVEFLSRKDPKKARVAVIPLYFLGSGLDYRNGSLWV
ncbi:MAG: hypothetical protein AABZ00_00205 [Chloroflexota bacterium]